MDYKHPIEPDDVLMTIADFKTQVADGGLIDDDGFGWPAKDGFHAMPDPEDWIYPSQLNIPADATHVVWCNS